MTSHCAKQNRVRRMRWVGQGERGKKLERWLDANSAWQCGSVITMLVCVNVKTVKVAINNIEMTERWVARCFDRWGRWVRLSVKFSNRWGWATQIGLCVEVVKNIVWCKINSKVSFVASSAVLSSLEEQVNCLLRGRNHSQLNIHFFIAGGQNVKLLYHLVRDESVNSTVCHQFGAQFNLLERWTAASARRPLAGQCRNALRDQRANRQSCPWPDVCQFPDHESTFQAETVLASQSTLLFDLTCTGRWPRVAGKWRK